MKSIYIFSILIAMLVLSCNTNKKLKLPYYSKEIEFEGNSLKLYSEGNIKCCRLVDTVEIKGYKCISWLWLFENTKLKQIETAVDIQKPDYIIPAHSVIYFNENNNDKIKYICFKRNVTINGVECRGGEKISTEFYEDGSLKACFLTKDQTVQGINCKSSLLEPVYFYPNGKIKIVTLASDLKSGDTVFKAGESITIDEKGMLAIFSR
jgi:hypothetical protein